MLKGYYAYTTRIHTNINNEMYLCYGTNWFTANKLHLNATKLKYCYFIPPIEKQH